MAFQSCALYPHLTVFENIAFPLCVQKLPESEVYAKVAKAAEVVQLTEKLHRKPGQRQRAAIGSSSVRNPKVVLIDELLANLDAALRGDMRVKLSQLHRALAATMIHVTHNQIEAMTMAHRIVVLNADKVEQFGTPMELHHHPATRYVATFSSQPNMNLIPATVLGADANGLAVERDGGTQMTLPTGPNTAKNGDYVEVNMRPENVGLGSGLSITIRVLEGLGGSSSTYGVTPNGQRFCAALPGDAKVAGVETITLRSTPPIVTCLMRRDTSCAAAWPPLPLKEHIMRVVTAGIGLRACHVLTTLKAEMPEIEIVGDYDPQPSCLDMIGLDTPRYDSVQTMLAQAKPDLFCVFSANLFHPDQIRMGFKAGMQVFTEKPVVVMIDAILELARLLAKHGGAVVQWSASSCAIRSTWPTCTPP